MRGDAPVPNNMEPHLRKLGLPTELIQGIVHLRSDYTVCKEGEALSPEQAQILVVESNSETL
jgi:mRNA turnover protein 4